MIVSAVKFMAPILLGFRGNNGIMTWKTTRIRYFGSVKLLTEFDLFLADHIRYNTVEVVERKYIIFFRKYLQLIY